MGIYFTSDTHFGHKNIIKYCDRPFTSVEEMDETMIQNWNSRVGPRDTIYHLGDFDMSKDGYDLRKVFDRLNGIKFLIKGSHDSAKTFLLNWGWIHEVHYLRWEGYRLWLSHHAHRVWPKSHKGAWHLFGHSHGVLPPHGRSFDVGVDSHNFMPWSFEEIKEKMEQIETSIVQ